jgi:hypothetical protein
MHVYSLAEQTILLTIICFSLLNLAFITALNQEKSFPKLFGLSFLLPLSWVCWANLSGTDLSQNDCAADQYLFLFYFYLIVLLCPARIFRFAILF